MPSRRIGRRAAAVLAGAALIAGAGLVEGSASGGARPAVADSSWGGIIAPDPTPTPTVEASAMTVNDSSWGG
ncbi:hypothetical protein [Kitasatospora sp. NPDC057738]|uniref:hypothetical protein n=1 Tax=Kitasatospora sp. NPDC057738 TaxID=3346233 RepID=UPI0036B9C34B